jgi:hypothetical protein
LAFGKVLSPRATLSEHNAGRQNIRRNEYFYRDRSCTHYRSLKSLGNSSLVSSLNAKFAKIQPALVILKLNRK